MLNPMYRGGLDCSIILVLTHAGRECYSLMDSAATPGRDIQLYD